MRFKRLTIVSDTALYTSNNKRYGFAPVVKEIEHISSLFEEIIWIGFKRLDRFEDGSLQEIQCNTIKLVLLNPVGGKGVINNLKIIASYPQMCFTICKYIYNANVVHTRAPSHPAFIAMLLSLFFKNKKWWHKYAGDWSKPNSSTMYSLQRKWLKNATFSKVTINGSWYNQPKHCITFENPCLTNENLALGKKIALQKSFDSPFVFTFIGRVEKMKGIDEMVKAFSQITLEKIKKVNIVGTSTEVNYYKEQFAFMKEKCIFHRTLSSDNVHKLLAETHFFILPSKSEGFPKVVSEAMCYGAIPIVSNVGSISQYVDKSIGFLWDFSVPLQHILLQAINCGKEDLHKMAVAGAQEANKFSFDNYFSKVQELLSNE